jgi:hypothetical protein
MMPKTNKTSNVSTSGHTRSCLVLSYTCPVLGERSPLGRWQHCWLAAPSHRPKSTWACLWCRPSPPSSDCPFVWVLGWSTRYHCANNPTSFTSVTLPNSEMYCSFECKKRHPNPPSNRRAKCYNKPAKASPAAGEANFTVAGVGREKYEV